MGLSIGIGTFYAANYDGYASHWFHMLNYEIDLIGSRSEIRDFYKRIEYAMLCDS